MTYEQAAQVAQQCADRAGIPQAVICDQSGEYFVVTCPQDIDDGITAVIDPSCWL